ncbi:hypothetical protein QWZ08_22650 [Ferruginibacter paludis]|uniref:hypothetical protein n=1 Tax=Ferruginibacter paludis TaxID=1310417 RepID=UPI0025B3B1B5|nr:hypothetical protein [Ferruginibacter paludis]MDN3658461.1 hypothetical protein [Ferruginibacter paludis]
MKKYLIMIMAVCAVFATLNSCKKTDGNINPLTDIKYLGVGSYLVQDSIINANLNSTSNTSTVGIIVHQYPAGEEVNSILLYATLGTSTDTTQWKLVKTIAYTTGSPATLTATTAELATAFGVSASKFEPGSIFTFFTKAVTKSGKTYDINNAGDNGGGGLITGPKYKAAFSFTVYVVCPYTGGMTGDYTVLRDDWVDWHAGDIVHITDGPGVNQINLSEVYPNGGTVINPIIVNIDPVTGTASIPKVIYGRYGGVNSTQYIAEGAGANDVAGYVFSCTGFITLSINQSDNGGGDYGPNKLILQKVQ